MSIASHYTVLGLIPTAPPEVIRASYKALALIYHPDKTLHIAPQERASYAVLFNGIQAAYDVLCNQKLKAAYDAELARHNNKVDPSLSTFHYRSALHTKSDGTSTPKRKPSMKLTTPEEKAAMRARAQQSMEYFREQRAKRDTEDAHADTQSLKNLVQIWLGLAQDYQHDQVMHEHCTTCIHEYQQKVAERERQHEEWLAKILTAKNVSVTPAKQQSSSTPDAPAKPLPSRLDTPKQTLNVSDPNTNHLSSDSASPTPLSRNTTRAEQRKRAEAEREAAAALRAQARQRSKAQREAAKQAQADQKAAAVRSQKEKLQAKIAAQAQQDAERMTRARAKARGAPLRSVGPFPGENDRSDDLQVGLQVVGSETNPVAVGRLPNGEGAS